MGERVRYTRDDVRVSGTNHYRRVWDKRVACVAQGHRVRRVGGSRGSWCGAATLLKQIRPCVVIVVVIIVVVVVAGLALLGRCKRAAGGGRGEGEDNTEEES